MNIDSRSNLKRENCCMRVRYLEKDTISWNGIDHYNTKPPGCTVYIECYILKIQKDNPRDNTFIRRAKEKRDNLGIFDKR